MALHTALGRGSWRPTVSTRPSRNDRRHKAHGCEQFEHLAQVHWYRGLARKGRRTCWTPITTALRSTRHAGPHARLASSPAASTLTGVFCLGYSSVAKCSEVNGCHSSLKRMISVEWATPGAQLKRIFCCFTCTSATCSAPNEPLQRVVQDVLKPSAWRKTRPLVAATSIQATHFALISSTRASRSDLAWLKTSLHRLHHAGGGKDPDAAADSGEKGELGEVDPMLDLSFTTVSDVSSNPVGEASWSVDVNRVSPFYLGRGTDSGPLQTQRHCLGTGYADRTSIIMGWQGRRRK